MWSSDGRYRLEQMNGACAAMPTARANDPASCGSIWQIDEIAMVRTALSTLLSAIVDTLVAHTGKDYDLGRSRAMKIPTH